MPKISQAHIKAWTFALPPLAEQRLIVQKLANESARLSDVAARVQRTVDLLREYRAALVTAAATGKIDVREEVPADAGQDA